MSNTEKAAENVAQTTQNEGGEAGLQKLEEEARNLVYTQPGTEHMTAPAQRQFVNDLQSATITDANGQKVAALPELALAWGKKYMSGGVNEESLRKMEESLPGHGGYNPTADNDPIKTLMVKTLREQYNALKNDKTVDANGDGTFSAQEIGDRLKNNTQDRTHSRDTSNYNTQQEQDATMAALLKDKNGTDLFKFIETRGNPSDANGHMSQRDLDWFVNQASDQNNPLSKTVTPEQLQALQNLKADWDNKGPMSKFLQNGSSGIRLDNLPDRYKNDPNWIQNLTAEGNRAISNQDRQRIVKELGEDPKLYGALVDSEGNISRDAVDKARNNNDLTADQRNTANQVWNSFYRMSEVDGQRDEKINVQKLAEAANGPAAKFEAPNRPEENPRNGEGDNNPNRGRTNSEASNDVRNLFSGEKGKTLYDRLTDGKDHFDAKDVARVQGDQNSQQGLTDEQKKYLAELNPNSVAQMDRNHDGKVDHKEIQEPINSAMDKSPEDYRQQSVNDREIQLRRQMLTDLAKNPQALDRLTDGQGNLKPGAAGEIKAYLENQAKAENRQLSEGAQNYLKYLDGLPKDQPIPLDKLAQDAGYADFRSFEVTTRTVKPAKEDVTNLATQLRAEDSPLKGLIGQDGKIDKAKLDSMYNNYAQSLEQNPEGRGGLSEKDEKALNTLYNSYGRLKNDGDAVNVQKLVETANQPEQPAPAEEPELETEKYNPVYRQDTLSGMAQRMGFGAGEAGWKAFIQFQADNGNQALAERLLKDPNKIYPADSFVIPKGGKLPPGYKPKS